MILYQELTSTRANAQVDPALHIWHYEVPLYLFLGGLVAGVMVLTGWLLWREGQEEHGRPEGRSRALALLPWAAPVLLSAGMLFLWLDLENRLNAFRFYLALRPSSPMSWGSWILLAVYPASILLAWASTPAELRRRILDAAARAPLPGAAADRLQGWLSALDQWTAARVRTLSAASMLAGAALGVYTGVLLGTMAARPLWNSAVLGPLFLVSGLSTGAAFLLLYRLADRERLLLGRIDMGLIAVELVLLGLWLAGLATGGAAAREAAALFLGGPYTAAFWTMVVAVGLVTPLVAEWLELRHGQVPGRLAAGLVLVGGLALRWILVYAGQHAGVAGAAHEIALHAGGLQ